MDRKECLLALLAVTLGVLSTLGVSLVVGHQYERAAARQAQLDLVKQQAEERAVEIKILKQAGLRFMSATNSLVNSLVFASSGDKALVEQFGLVQSACTEVLLMADEELARQTVGLNQSIAGLLLPSSNPLEHRLAELNVQVLEWIKHFRLSLENLKTQNEDLQSLKAGTQTVVHLKR